MSHWALKHKLKCTLDLFIQPLKGETNKRKKNEYEINLHFRCKDNGVVRDEQRKKTRKPMRWAWNKNEKKNRTNEQTHTFWWKCPKRKKKKGFGRCCLAANDRWWGRKITPTTFNPLKINFARSLEKQSSIRIRMRYNAKMRARAIRQNVRDSWKKSYEAYSFSFLLMFDWTDWSRWGGGAVKKGKAFINNSYDEVMMERFQSILPKQCKQNEGIHWIGYLCWRSMRAFLCTNEKCDA